MSHIAEERARHAAERQLAAYNAHDIDAFVGCYHPDVQVYDLKSGELRMQGRDAMRKGYAEMFEAYPDVCARVTNRTVVGNTALDREVVTGRGEPIHVVAIYEVDEDALIRRVWFVR